MAIDEHPSPEHSTSFANTPVTLLVTCIWAGGVSCCLVRIARDQRLGITQITTCVPPSFQFTLPYNTLASCLPCAEQIKHTGPAEKNRRVQGRTFCRHQNDLPPGRVPSLSRGSALCVKQWKLRRTKVLKVKIYCMLSFNQKQVNPFSNGEKLPKFYKNILSKEKCEIFGHFWAIN